MASVSRLDQDGRQGFRIRFYVDSRRRELYIAGLTKKSERQANLVAQHCDELSKAKSNNVSPAVDATAWANGTTGKLRENLVSWGLASPISQKLSTDEGKLLGPFLDSYIAGRSDIKATTDINYKQTRRLLVEYFGEKTALQSMTQADGDRWKRWMTARPMAVATVSKHCKRAKTMFQHAVRDRLLGESPFADIKGGSESNSARHHFVSIADSIKIKEASPDSDWRLIFALTRFGGLRCPSEVLGLKWTDVDWGGNRLRIDSPKTGLRFLPLFPEIKLAIDEAWELAPKGAIYCINRYRGGSEMNLRTQFIRIVESAGLTSWPKLFVNLRSTRRTELQEAFPDHVVNKWLGHSGKVAEKHYLQVTDTHFEKAIAFRPPTGSPINSDSGTIAANQETKKPCKLQGSDGAGWLLKLNVMTPTGVEPVLPP